MWSLLHNPTAHSPAWTLLPLVGSYLIYKLEKLTDQWLQAKLSLSSPSGNSELSTPWYVWNSTWCYPHAFRIPVRETPLSLGIPRCHLWYSVDIFWNHPIIMLFPAWRHGGLVVRLCLSPDQGFCVVFLDKTHNSHCASLHPTQSARLFESQLTLIQD